ncbi:ras-like GTP-binding protein RhoL [Wyeomyia smithii]|uniref:ras-like GTP-binding protein RhoL n=1 Tax=Wyeomyia smithii TaxID=174621 RepID=UPI00246818F1|nr:ras-like GTP-binding protein RhoL [Wyeomyia smithii]XP_055533002.1 ras-like GTP-binding protein RhoL [Wyeomyia smithii]XP_055533003.1 ras-like GTP-binding protein RhoL [Wyeomyia smithii]
MLPSDIVNIVVVGDGMVGKTCLLHAYTNPDSSFNIDYTPTIYDKGSIDLRLNGTDYTIQLHDTAGQEDFERIRRQFYKQANCFLLCYSIDSRVSFENVTAKWIPELTANLRLPIVLVATKVDTRRHTNKEVSTREGEQLARKINANAFIECSAKDGSNVEQAIEEAVRACLLGVPTPPEDDSCWSKCWPL